MRLSPCLAAAVFLTSAIAGAADPTPAPSTPQIVTLNPPGDKDAPSPPATTYKLSYGKVRVFKLDGFAKPVTWRVDQPVVGGRRQEVVRSGLVRKGGDVFGVLEGNALADKYVFDADVFCVVATGAGTGYVTVTAMSAEGGEVKVVAELIVEVVGGGNGPVPPPPKPLPQPDGALGLIKASRDGAAAVKASPTKDAEQKALAKAQRQLASAIAAGGVVDPKTGQFSAAAALAEWRAANNRAAAATDWGASWGKSVADALQALYTAGKLPDKKAWSDAFSEIAEGLDPPN